MPAAPSPALRMLFAQLEELFETEAQERISAGVLAAERALAEHLNQALRRLRQVAGFSEIAAVLRDASAPFCNGCAVFRVDRNIVAGAFVRGAEREADLRFREMQFPAAEASAFASAIESREPVATMRSAAQVSSGVASLFPAADGKAFLFPILVGQSAAGLIYAVGAAESAPLELLAQSAGMALEAGSRHPVPEVVQIAPAPPRHPKTAGPDWDALSPADRSLHLKAQRFARVQVAELRLYKAPAVESGRARGDLYSALQDAIDKAREAFRRDFVSASPAMTDYFHQELLRTLANDNPAIMGEKYPGPLV